MKLDTLILGDLDMAVGDGFLSDPVKFHTHTLIDLRLILLFERQSPLIYFS